MKTFKKSLAVLTTAAILSSSMAIVSYAASDVKVTWESALITKVEKVTTADTEDVATIEKGTGTVLTTSKTIKVTVSDATKIESIKFGADAMTPGADNTFTLDLAGKTIEDAATFAITVTEKSTGGGGGATGQPDAKEIAADNTVWVNGKDIKAKKGTTDPSYFYKSEVYRQVGQYAGGKWAVIALPTEYGTDKKDMTDVKNFLAIFDDKGKIADKNLTKAAKDLASAKLKDGQITVTAGKKAGDVVVWVYEINSKKIAADADDEKIGATINAETGAVTWPNNIKGAVHVDGIMPMATKFTVKMASSSPAFMTEKDFADASNFDATTKILTKDGAKKAVSKTTLLFKDGAEKQDAVVYNIVDKKAVVDKEAHWDIDKTGKNAFNTAVVNAELKDGKLTITPKGAGKTNVVVKNYESGKTAKFAVTVSKAFKVTVGEGVSITYKDENKKEQTKAGAATPVELWILEKTAVKVSADADVSGTEVKSGKTFKVEKAAAVTKKAAATTGGTTGGSTTGGESGSGAGGNSDTPTTT